MARQQIKREWDEAAQAIVAQFPDGETAVFSFRDLPEQSKLDCGMHGMEQKIFDSIAGEITKGTPMSEIRAELVRVYTALVNAEWYGKRGSSEGPSLNLLTLAAAKILGCGTEEARVRLAAKTVEERKALGALPQVKAIVRQIQADMAAEKAQTANVSPEALADLFGGGA